MLYRAQAGAFDGTLPKVESAFISFIKGDKRKPAMGLLKEACNRTAEQATRENVEALYALLGAYLEEAGPNDYMYPPLTLVSVDQSPTPWALEKKK